MRIGDRALDRLVRHQGPGANLDRPKAGGAIQPVPTLHRRQQNQMAVLVASPSAAAIN